MQPGYKLAEHEEETGSGGFALPVRTFLERLGKKLKNRRVCL